MALKKKYIFTILLTPLFWLLVFYAKSHPKFVESFYSTSFYPIFSNAYRCVFGWLPVSIGDVMIALLVFYFMKSLVILIRNRFKGYFDFILKQLSIVSILYCTFYFFWGFNYFREPLAKYIGLTKADTKIESLVKVTKRLIKKSNLIHAQLAENATDIIDTPYSNKEIYKLCANAYDILSIDYPQFKYTNSSIKSSLYSKLHSYGGTAGHLNPFTGEANINNQSPRNSIAFTTCHEIAHQIGRAPENEANFIGFLATKYSKDLYIQYSGYIAAVRYCLLALKKFKFKDWDLIYKSLSQGIRLDFKRKNEYILKHNSFVKPIISKGYSSYLKANNQKKGVNSYGYVVDLLIRYYNKLEE